MENQEKTYRLQGFSYLIRATEAVTNWRAIIMVCLSGVATFLVVMLAGWLATKAVFLGGLTAILACIVGLIGYSAVGILLMRQAQEQPIGLVDAILQATLTVHRLLGVALLLLLIFIGVALVALLLLFVCKIPGIGPLLYSLIFPVLAIVIGITITAMFYVGFPLAAPAVWEGNSVLKTVARLIGVVRQRLLTVVISFVLLALIVWLLSSVIFFILVSGYLVATGLSAKVGITAFAGNVPAVFAGAGMGAYTTAAAFATGLLFIIGSIVPALTFINGSCLVYLQAVDGMEFGQTEQKLQERVAEAKRRAQEARDRAQEKLNEAKAARTSAQTAEPQAAAPASPPAAETPRRCVHCAAPLAADDLFCGECGTQNPL